MVPLFGAWLLLCAYSRNLVPGLLWKKPHLIPATLITLFFSFQFKGLLCGPYSELAPSKLDDFHSEIFIVMTKVRHGDICGGILGTTCGT